MRRWRFAISIGCAIALAPPATAQLPEANESTKLATPIAATMIGDASLTDVCFVNTRSGWAVGERGAIWHTNNGGATWRLQPSGVNCRLNSVCFLDERHGWAAGGESGPASKTTRGVVLCTVDGGETWIALPRQTLPILRRVQFFTTSEGVAIGASSSLYPSGVFVTHDGGREWLPLPADKRGQWLAGDFLDPSSGAVAGAGGDFATTPRRQVVHSPLASSSSRLFHAMRLVAPVGGWLVGDGGLVMTTSDLGRSWQLPPGDVLTDVFSHFDFHAVAVYGPHVWIAGSPGTRVFHSPDNGRTWRSCPTGQTVPINSLTFADATHGWAVGELGSILASQDGGQTWQLQRSGGRRAALLSVFADASNVPLELIAEQGAAEGYLAAVEILHPRLIGDEVGVDPAAAATTREAMILAGATAVHTAWQFPLPPDDLSLGPEQLLNALNRRNDGRALQRLQTHLVAQLRMWRPDVVVTRHVPSNSAAPIAGLVEQLLLRSVDAAADPARAVQLAADAGLDPWQVKKVYGVLPNGPQGDEMIATGRFNARLGESLAGWTSPARWLVAADPADAPDALELRLLVNRLPPNDGANVGGLFHGITLSPGGEARRPLATDIASDIDDLRRRAARRHNLRELLERNEGNAAWVGKVEQLVGGLDAQGGAELLFQLADGYRKNGRLDLAADTFYLLARRHPEHPLSDPALSWLVQFYASSETAWCTGQLDAINVREAGSDREAERGKAIANLQRQDSQLRQASTAPSVGVHAGPAVGLSRDKRLQRAVQLGEYMETSRPILFAEPAIRFPLIAAQRQLGFAGAAKRYYLSLGQFPENDPWRRCAETEKWLSRPSETPPPKSLAHCRLALQRPHLDGILDEPFWQTADVLKLLGPDSFEVESRRESVRGNPTAVSEKLPYIENESRLPHVRLTHDAEYFYIAIRCPKVEGVEYAPVDEPRPRDADLSQVDRVALRLDLDRDFATWFELAVDSRGWTYEACWGDTHWNPTWYVAAADEPDAWTIEAAIPLAELASQPPATKDVWALGVRRTIPRVGYQSWCGAPADADSPDQFGLLIFE